MNWTSISTNLVANGPVHAFAISNGFLFAGTNNGVWRLPLSVNTIDPGWVHSPETFSLTQNFPNPFNPATTIRYSMPNRSQVLLTVYNTVGQKVATLVQEQQEAGSYEVKFDGSALASGVYFYRLQAGSFMQTRKLLLLR
jgi:hypothetical protein